MSALNFPNTGLYIGYQYTGDNGVVYIYDGVKWVGHSPNITPGSNSISNGPYVVQVDGSGNLVIPDGAEIIYQSGGPVANTGTIWTNDANGCLRAELSSTGFQAFTDATHLDLQDSGEWNIGSYQNSTFIGNDAFSNTNILSLKSGDETYITTNLRENGNHQWTFGADGILKFPVGEVAIGTNPDTQVTYFGAGVDGGGSISFSTTGNTYIVGSQNTVIDAGFGNDAPTKHWTFDTNGDLTLPTGGSIYGLFIIGDEGANVAVDHSTEQVYIRTYLDGDPSSKEWAFGSDGSLTLPSTGTIVNLESSGIVLKTERGQIGRAHV